VAQTSAAITGPSTRLANSNWTTGDKWDLQR
jgi:hypothetical protein